MEGTSDMTDTITTPNASKQQFLAALESELAKHEWTKDPERWAHGKAAILATLNGSRSCALSESWAAAWKAIGMKGKPTYKGIHALPEAAPAAEATDDSAGRVA